MAEEMRALNGWLVHYSTDYVFDGSGTAPWSETDRPAPLNLYGQSKLQGEQAIAQSGCQHLIFRTSGFTLRGVTTSPKPCCAWPLSVIDDQVGAPTGAELLADVTAHALRQSLAHPQLSGLYHLAATGETSWCGYARYVIEQARSLGAVLAVQNIEPILTTAYPTPAKRPHNSRLDTSKVSRCFALQLPDWQSGVSRMLKEI